MAKIVIIFKQTRIEDTLAVMHKGALKTEKLLTGKVLVMAQVGIARTLERCQQDFDNTYLGLTRKNKPHTKVIRIHQKILS